MESTNSENTNNDSLMALTSMGFDLSQSQSALDMASGNVEYAINYLLNQPDDGDGTNNGSASNENMSIPQSVNSTLTARTNAAIEQIQGSTSQYSYEQGRSACSFIALSAATTILNDTRKGISITKSLIDEAIQSGCNTYNEWKITNQKNGSIEHTSVEEILLGGYYSNLKLLSGGIRQGMLSNDPNGPLSLRTLLLDCQSSTEWICVVVIKPPETILLVLPPSSVTTTTSNNKNESRYQCSYLFDSHPRRMEFGADHAYCRIHESITDLVQSVSDIFPLTDLGPDVSEYMSSMYNSFDLYALHLVSKNTSTEIM